MRHVSRKMLCYYLKYLFHFSCKTSIECFIVISQKNIFFNINKNCSKFYYCLVFLIKTQNDGFLKNCFIYKQTSLPLTNITPPPFPGGRFWRFAWVYIYGWYRFCCVLFSIYPICENMNVPGFIKQFVDWKNWKILVVQSIPLIFTLTIDTHISLTSISIFQVIKWIWISTESSAKVSQHLAQPSSH